eukprot:13574519-Alexandrium_andersonii.AAC.1
MIGAVLFLTCFEQAHGDDFDNARVAIAYSGNFNLREAATTFLMVVLGLWVLRAMIVQILADLRGVQ